MLKTYGLITSTTKKADWELLGKLQSHITLCFTQQKQLSCRRVTKLTTMTPLRVALGHLLVPTELEKEDLEILNQSHKIFEDEYIH